jgi:hypothetical protein|tara:strand:+ start:48 stop:551 length:504 start_codon:yes stop_codon:yes gene_type:complete
MEQIDWDSVKVRINEMLAADSEINAIPAEIAQMARSLLNIGDGNPANWGTVTDSVKSLLKPYPGYPYKRGNQGILPAAARAVVDSACAEIDRAFSAAFAETEQFAQPLLRKHGKSTGAATYGDASAYGSALAKKARGAATKLYKAGVWDGTLEGLSNCVEYDTEEEE